MGISRKQLLEVRRLEYEINMWEDKLDELHRRAESIGSPSDMEITGVRGTSKKDKIAELAADIADTEDIINGLLAETRIKRRDMLIYIKNIDDSLLRQIIYLRCYECKSWRDVAMGTGTSIDTVKHMFYRAIDKK